MTEFAQIFVTIPILWDGVGKNPLQILKGCRRGDGVVYIRIITESSRFLASLEMTTSYMWLNMRRRKGRTKTQHCPPPQLMT